MPKTGTDIPDHVAKADMGFAFSLGAQGSGQKTLHIEAIALGDRFLTNRLANKKKPYMSVRKKALKVADAVGISAATYAGTKAVITKAHLQAALDDLRRGRILGGDCPF